MIEEIWEMIEDKRYTDTKRMKVFGGWMVAHRELFENDQGESLTSIFVSDPEHKWKI